MGDQEGLKGYSWGEADLPVFREDTESNVLQSDQLTPGAVVTQKCSHPFRTEDREFLSRKRLVPEEHESGVVSDMSMGEDDPVERILTCRERGISFLQDCFQLRSYVRGCIHQKSLMRDVLQESQRSDQPLMPGFPSSSCTVRAITPELGHASVLGCAQDFDRDFFFDLYFSGGDICRGKKGNPSQRNQTGRVLQTVAQKGSAFQGGPVSGLWSRPGCPL